MFRSRAFLSLNPGRANWRTLNQTTRRCWKALHLTLAIAALTIAATALTAVAAGVFIRSHKANRRAPRHWLIAMQPA